MEKLRAFLESHIDDAIYARVYENCDKFQDGQEMLNRIRWTAQSSGLYGQIWDLCKTAWQQYGSTTDFDDMFEAIWQQRFSRSEIIPELTKRLIEARRESEKWRRWVENRNEEDTAEREKAEKARKAAAQAQIAVIEQETRRLQEDTRRILEMRRQLEQEISRFQLLQRKTRKITARQPRQSTQSNRRNAHKK